MSTPKRLRRPLAVLAAAALLGLPAGAQSADGVSYRIRLTTRMPGGGGGPVMLARGTAANGRARLDFQAFDPAPKDFSVEDYLLFDDSARVFIVNRPSQSYRDGSKLALPGRSFAANGGLGAKNVVTEMKGAGGTAPPLKLKGEPSADAPPIDKARPAPNAHVRDVVTTLERLGAGEAIEGRPTQRYRLALSYSTMRGDIPTPTALTIEVWTAALPVGIVNPFDPFGNGRYDMAGPTAELDAKLEAVRRQLTGTPIRIVVTQAVPEAGAKMPDLALAQLAIVQTIQLTQVSAIPAREAAAVGLAVPTGYVRK